MPKDGFSQTVKDHEFDPATWSNLFQGLLSGLTTSWDGFNQDRLCKICEEGFVEDDIHFVCVCSKYWTERENFHLKLSNKYINLKILNAFDKFIYIKQCCF